MAIHDALKKFTREKQDAALRSELVGHALRIGAEAYTQILGNNGYADMDEVLANATGEQITTIIRELEGTK